MVATASLLVSFFCAAWLVVYARLAGNVLALGRLSDVAPEAGAGAAAEAAAEETAPAEFSSLSVIIPARDEAEHVAGALLSLLDHPDPRLEVVLVDDRSTDGTGDIVARLAERDARLRMVRVEALPDGWLGKPHALARGLQHATGEWVLFSDGDVRFSSRALGRAVTFAVRHELDHLAVFPDLIGGTFPLQVAAGAFGDLLLARVRMSALADRNSHHSIGIGAFNLVRRSFLEKTPGFEWLRMEVADDMGLARMIKLAGGKAAVLSGADDVGVPWYRNMREMIRGLEKNTVGFVGAYRPLRTLFLSAFMALFAIAPLVAFLPGIHPMARGLAVAALAAPVACALPARTRFRRQVLPSFFAAGGLLVLAWILLRSGYHAWRRGGIVWRGTFHSLDELRRGRRMDFLK